MAARQELDSKPARHLEPAMNDERNPKNQRAERLRSALRENLKRRKAQARGRELDRKAGDESGSGPEPGDSPERPPISPDLPPKGPDRN